MNSIESVKKATVIASKKQLESIGIDEELTNVDVKVYDIDKFRGAFNMLCSTILVDSKFEHLKSLNIHVDYMIPTEWLVIKS